jgi:hypothetical protein
MNANSDHRSVGEVRQTGYTYLGLAWVMGLPRDLASANCKILTRCYVGYGLSISSLVYTFRGDPVIKLVPAKLVTRIKMQQGSLSMGAKVVS